MQLIKISIIFGPGKLIFKIFSVTEQKFLSYRDSQISYLRFGSGPRKALCFHGYGEDAGSFAFLDKYAGDHYTFFSIDLPFHGKTDWKEGLNFTTEILLEIISNILSKENSGLSAGSFGGTQNSELVTLLGFSLGGRIALSLYQLEPGKIDRLILLAPDGLKMNFWYWLSTQTWMGNQFFGFTMKRPGWFFGFLKLMNKLGLVNASIFKFVNHYIGDEQVRRSLYTRWTTLRKLKPDIKKIRTAIRENNTVTRIMYGQHDRIILSSVGNRFKKGIEDQCTITVIHSGHQVLHEKHIAEILPALL